MLEELTCLHLLTKEAKSLKVLVQFPDEVLGYRCGSLSSGLRKVTNEMKTYKNPELRGSSVVKAGDIKKTEAAPKYGSAVAAKKPPVLALQGKKWVVVSVYS